jgi:predicted transcriptional regulator
MGLRSDHLRIKKVQPIPKGWATCAQIRHREKLSDATTKRWLKELIAAGVWQRRQWKMLTPGGLYHQVSIYRKKP